MGWRWSYKDDEDTTSAIRKPAAGMRGDRDFHIWRKSSQVAPTHSYTKLRAVSQPMAGFCPLLGGVTGFKRLHWTHQSDSSWLEMQGLSPFYLWFSPSHKHASFHLESNSALPIWVWVLRDRSLSWCCSLKGIQMKIK